MGSNPTPTAGKRLLTRQIGRGPSLRALPVNHRGYPSAPGRTGTPRARVLPQQQQESLGWRAGRSCSAEVARGLQNREDAGSNPAGSALLSYPACLPPTFCGHATAGLRCPPQPTTHPSSHPVCRRPTHRGAGAVPGVQVERATVRTTWTPGAVSARLCLGRRQTGWESPPQHPTAGTRARPPPSRSLSAPAGGIVLSHTRVPPRLHRGFVTHQPKLSGVRTAAGLERGADRSAGPGDGPRAPRRARRVP